MTPSRHSMLDICIALINLQEMDTIDDADKQKRKLMGLILTAF